VPVSAAGALCRQRIGHCGVPMRPTTPIWPPTNINVSRRSRRTWRKGKIKSNRRRDSRVKLETDRETAMRQFMMPVTALVAFAAMLATAQAEILHGGPIKNGNQCFKYSAGNDKDGRFGTWGACSQETSGRPRAAPRLLPSDLRGPDRQLEARPFIAMTSTARAECLSSAGAVWNAHPGSHATWRLQLAGHQGTKCWFARNPKIVQAPRIRQVVESPRARTAERRTDEPESPARLESEQSSPAGERWPPSILLWGKPWRIDPTWEDLFERRERGAE
jgi:hypothetical protein